MQPMKLSERIYAYLQPIHREKTLLNRIVELEHEVSYLNSVLTELQQDAKRYRWLRNNVQPEYARKQTELSTDWNMKWQIKTYLTAMTAVASEVTLDEAIDTKLDET
jgi:hypothetical protein